MRRKIKEAIRAGHTTRNEIAEFLGLGRKHTDRILSRLYRDGSLSMAVSYQYIPFADGQAVDIKTIRKYGVQSF